jgi:hypothetical protein
MESLKLDRGDVKYIDGETSKGLCPRRRERVEVDPFFKRPLFPLAPDFFSDMYSFAVFEDQCFLEAFGLKAALALSASTVSHSQSPSPPRRMLTMIPA